MPYRSRIPAEPDYVEALGRALYNFLYLEWVVVSTIRCLRPGDPIAIPKGESSASIAKALINAIDQTAPPLSANLRKELAVLHTRYVAAIRVRNKLIHSHPATHAGGQQGLTGAGRSWSVDDVYDAAKLFEEVAISGNALYYGMLKIERP